MSVCFEQVLFQNDKFHIVSFKISVYMISNIYANIRIVIAYGKYHGKCILSGKLLRSVEHVNYCVVFSG